MKFFRASHAVLRPSHKVLETISSGRTRATAVNAQKFVCSG